MNNILFQGQQQLILVCVCFLWRMVACCCMEGGVGKKRFHVFKIYVFRLMIGFGLTVILFTHSDFNTVLSKVVPTEECYNSTG